MQRITSTIGLSLAAASAALVGGLAFPAAASAAVSAGAGAPPPAAVAPAPQDWGHNWGDPTDWDHPEWGPGWNHGHPARLGPAARLDAAARLGSAGGLGTAAGMGAAWRLVGPCSGPLHDLLRPARCL